jgi:predicted DNA repair protein MutK
MDDIGLALAQRTAQLTRKVGRGLVAAMPKVLAALSSIGTVAMLWVGGHILLQGSHTVGWHTPYEMVHHLEELVHHPVLAWLVNTAVSAVIGLVVGAVIVAIAHVLPFGKDRQHTDA